MQQVVCTDQMVEMLNLPRTLVACSGEFLLAYGALVAFLSTRAPAPPGDFPGLVRPYKANRQSAGYPSGYAGVKHP